MAITQLHQLARERSNALSEASGDTLWKLETGFPELDLKTGGIRSGDLVVIAARPGMGKNIFAQNLTKNISAHCGSGGGVLLFSSEMTGHEITNHLLSDLSGIDIWKIRNDRLNAADLAKINNAARRLEKYPLYIDDTTHMTIADFSAHARQITKDNFIPSAIIVNDLNLLLPYNRASASYEQHLDEVTHGLRDLAHELETPIIVMIDIPRYNSENGDPAPNLTELKTYGSLEKDASIIIFLHRPDYYQLDNPNFTENHIAELLIRKNIHGPSSTVKIYLDPEKLKFMPLKDE